MSSEKDVEEYMKKMLSEEDYNKYFSDLPELKVKSERILFFPIRIPFIPPDLSVLKDMWKDKTEKNIEELKSSHP